MQADRELAFISALLTTNRGEQELFAARALPINVFKIREKEIAWVYRFHEKHGVYPSPFLFHEKFNLKVTKPDDSLDALFQPIVDFDQYQQVTGLIEKCNEFIVKDRPMGEIMEFFRTSAANLRSYSSNSLADIEWQKSKGAIHRYKTLVENLKNDVAIMDSPWATLNKLIRFVRPGELITLYGRPASGKTWIAINWALHLARRNLHVLFITKEMPSEQIEDRFEALHFRLNWEKFRSGTMTPIDLFRWRKARHKQPPFRLTIAGDETIEGVGTDYVVRKVKETKADVAFIDGSYLMEVPGLSRNAGPVERLTALTRFFKRLAKTQKLPIFAITQENRSGEDKKGDSTKLGGLTTIYGADSWGQDSDFVIKAGVKRQEPNYRQIFVEKGRESAIGSFFINSLFDPVLNFNETAAPQKAKQTTLKIKTDIKLK